MNVKFAGSICLLAALWAWSCVSGQGQGGSEGVDLDRYRTAADHIRASPEALEYMNSFGPGGSPDEIRVMDSLVFKPRSFFYRYLAICRDQIDSTDRKSMNEAVAARMRADSPRRDGKTYVRVPDLNKLNRVNHTLPDTAFVLYFTPIDDGLMMAELIRKVTPVWNFASVTPFNRGVEFLFDFDFDRCPFVVSGLVHYN